MRKALSFFLGNRWLRWGAWTLGGLLALWALGWLALPPILKAQIERIASEQLGRTVTVGRVQFLPWTLELSVHDLRIATADGSASQLQVKRLYIDAELQSLVRLAPVADALQVDEPVLHITQTTPGHYDIDDILARFHGQPENNEKSAPLRFALYNIALTGGSVDFDDKTVGRVHTLRQAELSVPFLSNLSAHRDVKVAPRLAFEFNGSSFESTALATPFAEGHKAEVRFQIKGFDLAPFAGYLPGSVPAKLESGSLDADLQLTFEQATSPIVKVHGQVALHAVKIKDASQRDLVAFDALRMVLSDVQPLKKVVHIASLEWDGLHTELRRSASGGLDLPGWTPAPSPTAASSAQPPAPSGEAKAWQVTLARLSLHGAKLGWTDGGIAGGPAHWEMRNLNLHGSDIAWPMLRPLQFNGGAELAGVSVQSTPARLAFEGEATDHHATVAVSIRQLPLELAAPYLQAHIVPRLSGVLDTDVGLAWNGPAMVAKVAHLSLDSVALSCAPRGPCPSLREAGVPAPRSKSSLVELQRLEVEDLLVHLQHRSVTASRIAIKQPKVLVERNAKGQWMFDDWLLPASRPSVKSSGSAQPAPWAFQVAEASLEDGAVALRDLSNARPVSVNLSAVQMRVRDFAPLATKTPPSVLTVAARVGSGRFEPGRISYEGTLGVSPLSVQGRVQASHLPLHAFEPYVGDQLNASIIRAEGSFVGDVRHTAGSTGASTVVRGDMSLDEVRVRSAVLYESADTTRSAASSSRGGEDLLNWKSLALRGVDLTMVPGKPLSLDVKATSLSDFFARIIVQESGRINLQDLRKAVAEEGAEAGNASERVTQPPAPVAVDTASSDNDLEAPVIHFGPVTLVGGSVHFTDNFVKPHYSADLSELAGRLSAFSSQAPAGDTVLQMADLELRGRAEGTASLEIVGKLNPLAKPLALDIQGHMRDLELPPLSPYSIKYAGHGIERGKLSMDVTYRVLPNGQLTASNKLVLNQLAFGEPVEGAPASLPVRLAVALLADRNGVIDVDLPISGSLNDPEFRLGSVILRVIGNLVMKAITAPFSLLAGALGSSDELESVDFVPGSAILTPDAQQGLAKVAKALSDRPALKMTVVGEARLDAERDAWKRERLQGLVAAQKRRSAARDGRSPDQVGPVTEQEYPALLKEVYRRTDMDKPRNLVGMAKDVPQGEMESLLLATIQVPDNAMRELALARGVAVRDYLAAQKVPLERLFVGAARTDSREEKWVPHAALTLAAR